jgi:hypothetical protein
MGFPALRGLGINPRELIRLRHQGYLEFSRPSSRRRGYWRLRQRDDEGRLRTYYVGMCPVLLNDVQHELVALRGARTALLHARRLRRQAHEAMRKVKPKLMPMVERNGCRFHGLTIRKRRGAPINPVSHGGQNGND